MSGFTGPLTLGPVQVRLKTLGNVLRMVEGAAELEALLQNGPPRATPAAFVLHVGDQSNPSKGYTSGLHVQETNGVISVLIAVRNLRNPDTGGAASDDAAPIVASVRSALINWRHPDAKAPFDLVSGKTLQIDQGVLWWQEIYRTQYRIEVRT